MEEDYKKKYENLIERLRRAKETKGGYTFKSVVDEFVPELAESEEEKIRKALIDTFQYYSASKESPYLHNISKEQILAWLEKQGEQKPEINDNILLRFAFYQYDDDDTLYLSSVFVEECNRKHGYGTKILKAAEEVAKTFGISKIRLKVETNSWMEDWYKRNGYEYLTSEGKYDYLEKVGEHNEQNFWERCKHCEYFDGYDLCLHKKNFGSVTNESKENCKNNNFFIENQGEQKTDEG